MAKFYRDASGVYGLRRNVRDEQQHPIPPGSTVVEFDESTNQAIIDSLSGKVNGFRWQDHAINGGGQILRSGTPLAINPDSSTKTEKSEFDSQLQTAITRLGQIKTAADAGMTNAQRDTAIGDLAVVLRRALRMIAQLRALQEN